MTSETFNIKLIEGDTGLHGALPPACSFRQQNDYKNGALDEQPGGVRAGLVLQEAVQLQTSEGNAYLKC